MADISEQLSACALDPNQVIEVRTLEHRPHCEETSAQDLTVIPDPAGKDLLVTSPKLFGSRELVIPKLSVSGDSLPLALGQRRAVNFTVSFDKNLIRVNGKRGVVSFSAETVGGDGPYLVAELPQSAVNTILSSQFSSRSDPVHISSVHLEKTFWKEKVSLYKNQPLIVLDVLASLEFQAFFVIMAFDWGE